MSEKQKKTLGIAIASLVLGCLFWFPFLGVFCSLAAIILGIMALSKISKNKDALEGRGLAIAGITLGGVGVLIIILLVAFVLFLPRCVDTSEYGKTSISRADINANIATALKLYELDNGSLPATDEGLSALLEAPSSANNWEGPYLKKEPEDAWGNPYKYVYPGIYNKDSYDLSSYGPDGIEDTEDDIRNNE